MGSILCEHCTAACCRYLAIPLDVPSNKRDYDDIRWYLMHNKVTVFVEDDEWYIQWQTTCNNLGDDNLCQVYETRPAICGEYEAQDCDYAGGSYGYDHLFTHPKQIEEYYYKKTGRRIGAARPRKIKSAKPRRKSKENHGGSLVTLTMLKN